MSEPKKPQKKPYTVTSAFVWDGKIRKPSDKGPVYLTATEAHGLKNRGKVEDSAPAKSRKPATAKKADEPKSNETKQD